MRGFFCLRIGQSTDDRLGTGIPRIVKSTSDNILTTWSNP